jgi:hypothetical protein
VSRALELIDRLGHRLFAHAGELLARLEADGLISGNARVDLTDDGKALHPSLREHIAGPTLELLSQFDVDDIETTVHTLKAIAKRAEERLASAGG